MAITPSGAELIATERKRQVREERWSPEHDDEHNKGELAKAAAVYAVVEQTNVIRMLENLGAAGWPWEALWFKPFESEYRDFPAVDRIRCLVKAGALIAAEIDRLQRVQSQTDTIEVLDCGCTVMKGWRCPWHGAP